MQSTIAAIQTWGDDRKGTTDELIAALTVRLIHAEASLGHSARMPTDPLIKSVLDLAQGPTSLRVKTGLRVFTDGSCTANGRRGARAGIGVYATRDDVPVKAHSAPLLPDEPQTNQRAELQALYHGLAFISDQPSPVANVYTDSKYSLDCLQRWSNRWIKDNWCKADGKPVLHQDLLKPMVALWNRLSKTVTLHHVAAHTGASDPLSVGNAKADELATMATGNTPTAGGSIFPSGHLPTASTGGAGTCLTTAATAGGGSHVGVTEAMVTGIRDPSDYSRTNRTNGATISFGTTTGVKKTTMSFNPYAEPNILSLL